MSYQLPRLHLIAAGGAALAIIAGLSLNPSADAGNPSHTLNDAQARTGQPTAAESAAAMDLTGEAAGAAETVSAKPAAALEPLETAALTQPAEQPEAGAPVTGEAGDKLAAAPGEEPLDWHTYRVRSGDSLSTLFKRAGLPAAAMLEVIRGEGEAQEFERLYRGESLKFGLGADGRLQQLVLERNRMESVVAQRQEDGFTAEIVSTEPNLELHYATGTIKDSLYLAAKKAGIEDRVTMKLAGIFGWDVDFVYDIRQGDSFEVLYERQFLEGEKIGTGRILAARFINQGREIEALLYTDASGESDYYTPEGKSVRKAFLRAPINARISSPFNLQRRHPVLGVVRPHEGTDYAAPPGTPIKAAGDGRVHFIGRKGGYGRTVILQHGDNISTLYAHMRAFPRGLRHGDRVRQGQTIGYLGASGLATGPHLHYEFRLNGVPRNSRTVKLPEAEPVPASEMARFKSQTARLVARFEQFANRYQVALAEE